MVPSNTAGGLALVAEASVPSPAAAAETASSPAPPPLAWPCSAWPSAASPPQRRPPLPGKTGFVRFFGYGETTERRWGQRGLKRTEYGEALLPALPLWETQIAFGLYCPSVVFVVTIILPFFSGFSFSFFFFILQTLLLPLGEAKVYPGQVVSAEDKHRCV